MDQNVRTVSTDRWDYQVYSQQKDLSESQQQQCVHADHQECPAEGRWGVPVPSEWTGLRRGGHYVEYQNR